MITRTDLTAGRLLIAILTIAGIVLGIAIGVLSRDVIIGAIVGALFVAVAIQLVHLWTRGGPPVVPH